MGLDITALARHFFSAAWETFFPERIQDDNPEVQSMLGEIAELRFGPSLNDTDQSSKCGIILQEALNMGQGRREDLMANLKIILQREKKQYQLSAPAVH